VCARARTQHTNAYLRTIDAGACTQRGADQQLTRHAAAPNRGAAPGSLGPRAAGRTAGGPLFARRYMPLALVTPPPTPPTPTPPPPPLSPTSARRRPSATRPHGRRLRAPAHRHPRYATRARSRSGPGGFSPGVSWPWGYPESSGEAGLMWRRCDAYGCTVASVRCSRACCLSRICRAGLLPAPAPTRAPLPTHSQPLPCLFSLPILTNEALVLEPPGAETAEVLLTPRRRDSGWTASTRLVDLAKRACSRRSQADALPLRLIFRLAKTLVTYPRMDRYSRALCLSLWAWADAGIYPQRDSS
jgi:hypothetical protein